MVRRLVDSAQKQQAEDKAGKPASRAADEGRRWFLWTYDEPPTGATQVLPLSLELIEEAGWELAHVSWVTIGRGPRGTFLFRRRPGGERPGLNGSHIED